MSQTHKGARHRAFYLCHKPRSKSVTRELIKLGEKVITSFDDGSKASVLCTARYPALRDQLLRDHTWAFSKTFVALAVLAEASEVTPWEYQFQLPSDVARILSLSVEDHAIEYEQVGTILHTVENTADLRYIHNFADVDDGFAFPDDFAEVLANFLAAELALSMTQTQTLRDTYLNMYMERLRAARFNGAVERDLKPIVESSWMDAHIGILDTPDPTTRGLSGY